MVCGVVSYKSNKKKIAKVSFRILKNKTYLPVSGLGKKKIKVLSNLHSVT